MTDYDDRELSIDEAQPYELYEWVGTYRSYYMTSDSVPHNFNGNTYNVVPGLLGGNAKAGTHEEDNIDLDVKKVPITEQLVKDYGFQTTPPALELIIYRLHRDATSYAVWWRGPVTSISISGEFATIRSPSKFSNILQGNIPSVYIQPPCNHVLFDSLCKVSRVDNSLDTTVASITGLVIAIPSLGGFPDGWFVGGEIAVPARNERRMIVGQSGTALTINYAFSRLSVGTAVQVTAGCDHSFTGSNGCPKFSNQINFGGCPYVPGETNNPFVFGVD